MDGKFTNSVASPSNSLEGAHVHAINTRPSFLPRGAESEASCDPTRSAGRQNHATPALAS